MRVLVIPFLALVFATPPAAAGPKPPGFIILSVRDAKSTRALVKLFTFEETGEPMLATSARDAAQSRAEVVVLSFGAMIPRDTDLARVLVDLKKLVAEIGLPDLKKKKLIAIDYRAAKVFGKLGLNIRAGNCDHGMPPILDIRGGNCALGMTPTVVLEENTLFEPKAHEDVINVFDPPIRDRKGNYGTLIFGLNAPPGGELDKKIDVIARFRRGPYVPVARQGQFVLVCLDSPVQTWSAGFKRLVRDVAIGLHGGLKRERWMARGKSDAGGLKLTVSMFARVAADQPISLSVVVENFSAAAAHYVPATVRNAVVVAMTTAKGEPIPFTRLGQAAHDKKDQPLLKLKVLEKGVVLPTQLFVGQKIEGTVNLGRVFDLSLPGQYKVTVRLALGKKKPLVLEVRGLRFAVLER